MSSNLSQNEFLFSVSNIKNYVGKTLTYTNYLFWKSFFPLILITYDVLRHVGGTSLCTPKTFMNDNGEFVSNPSYFIWIKIDNLILSWIQSTLSINIL